MGIEDFIVPRDKFEVDTAAGTLAFPCCCCRHRGKTDREPCRHCDHNLACVPDDEN